MHNYCPIESPMHFRLPIRIIFLSFSFVWTFFTFFFLNNQPTERFKESDWTERIRGLDTKTKSKCKKQDEKQNKII